MSVGVCVDRTVHTQWTYFDAVDVRVVRERDRQLQRGHTRTRAHFGEPHGMQRRMCKYHGSCGRGQHKVSEVGRGDGEVICADGVKQDGVIVIERRHKVQGSSGGQVLEAFRDHGVQ